MPDDDGATDPSEAAPQAATIAHHGRAEANPLPPRLVHPPAYRDVVAGWPEDWRERWGRRANDLEEAGLSWRDAEAQAFVEVWSLVRHGRHPSALATPGSGVERN